MTHLAREDQTRTSSSGPLAGNGRTAGAVNVIGTANGSSVEALQERTNRESETC